MKARRKLIPAIAMLVVSAIVLTSASYAWFTMSRSVTADGISLKAIAPTNLLISDAEDGTYSESVTIKKTFTKKLIPASTVDGMDFYAPNQILTAEKGAPTAKTTFFKGTDVLTEIAEATDGYYVDFNLWLKTTGESAVDVTVAQLLTLIKDNSKKADEAAASDLYNAVRFAVLDNSSGTPARFAAATKSGDYIYGTNAGTSTIDYFATLTGPLDAKCLDTVINTDAFKGVDVSANVNAKTELFTCAANGVATPITVRMWIEGQDKDCVAPAEGVIPGFDFTVGFADVAFTEANPA